MDGCNWSCELTQYIWTVSACLKENLKILDHCKWPPEIIMVPLKCMAVSAALKWNPP